MSARSMLRVFVLGVAVCLGLGMQRAAAGTLYGAIHFGGENFTLQERESTLYTVDPATGTKLAVGLTGFASVSGMDFDPATGVLYATGLNISTGANVLLTIDPNTGIGTEVGPTGFESLVGGAFRNTTDLSIRNADGVIFVAVKTRFAVGDDVTYIGRIDKTTGAGTILPASGLGFGSGGALAFSPADVLYLTGVIEGEVFAKVYTVDQVTGATTVGPTLTYSGFDPPLSTGFIREGTIDFNPEDGVAYVVVKDGFRKTEQLATLDPVAGSVVGIGTGGPVVGNGLGALAWKPVGPRPDPCDDDTEAPTLAGVPADATVECDAVPAAADVTATDNCDTDPVVTLDENTADGSCVGESTLTRTWTATDASGNAAQAVQTITIVDTTAPQVTCPGDITTADPVVTYDVTAADACDPHPVVTLDVPSGSTFAVGTTTVTATATDDCGNSASCSFDVTVLDDQVGESCLGVWRAVIGTGDLHCRGISSLEVTSQGPDGDLVGVYSPSGGSVVVDDGVNGPQTIDTSGSTPIDVGDVFGAYTVTNLWKEYDADNGPRGDQIRIFGSFSPTTAVDLAVDDVTLTVDDGQGHSASVTIPAGSFVQVGNPDRERFLYFSPHGSRPRVWAWLNLSRCRFAIAAAGVAGLDSLVGTTINVSVQAGGNLGQETIEMYNRRNHLAYRNWYRPRCCPHCTGIASMQVTSNQGVFTYEPRWGMSQLGWYTFVYDGVNPWVWIPTSCYLRELEVGDVFGAYTISDLVFVGP